MGKKRLLGILAVLAVILAVVTVLLVLGPGAEESIEEGIVEQTEDGNDPLYDDDHEPVYPGGDVEPTYHRAPPTEEELAEDLAEIRRMHAELPGNYWLPPIPGEENAGPSEEQQRQFSENERLRRKVRNNSATPEEKRTYLAHRKKITEDRIAVIEYYMKRAQESPGQKWFAPEDIESGKERIAELRARISRIEAELQ